MTIPGHFKLKLSQVFNGDNFVCIHFILRSVVCKDLLLLKVTRADCCMLFDNRLQEVEQNHEK
jgi:hypothetical protein